MKINAQCEPGGEMQATDKGLFVPVLTLAVLLGGFAWVLLHWG